jgi:GNAT superfamily N-acetyltransferase
VKAPLVTIRRASRDDASAIAEVHVASWRTTFPGIIDQAYIDTLSVTERATAWAHRLSAEPDAAPDILVATTSDGGIAGFSSSGAIRDPLPGFDAELHAIYLLDCVQQAGVGRRLVREWARLALGRGWHAAVVRVLAANPACRFYERLGAEHLQDTQLVIAGNAYPERWYGWRNLHDLTA